MQAQRERGNSNENQLTFHFETFYSVMKTYVLCFAFSVFVILMNNRFFLLIIMGRINPLGGGMHLSSPPSLIHRGLMPRLSCHWVRGGGDVSSLSPGYA